MLRDFLIAVVIAALILAPAHLDIVVSAIAGLGAAATTIGAVTGLCLLAAGCRGLRRQRGGLGLWLGVILAAAPPAYADTGGTIVEAVRPALTEFAVGVILALLALAYRRISAWTGIEIEARHREALQSALANGVRAAMAQGGGMDVERVIDLASGYVERSVPDALAALKVDYGKLRVLLEPHAGAALRAAT